MPERKESVSIKADFGLVSENRIHGEMWSLITCIYYIGLFSKDMAFLPVSHSFLPFLQFFIFLPTPRLFQQPVIYLFSDKVHFSDGLVACFVLLNEVEDSPFFRMIHATSLLFMYRHTKGL